ncbi:hypothetical protein IFM89_006174 [Coptis chinensis]|uniref:RNase H type-1 domain-containing protein n=1 Tax=Coptis chinensis TaxID=261450 RepID=A0A835LB53_9MAGN|nr:hypothetical protein IFM89_006174 [Coptis chinensis]
MHLYFQRNLLDVNESASLRILAGRLGLKLSFKDSAPNWIKWAPAVEDSFMLNTDGLVQENGNRFGGIIRDSLGNISLAYAGSSHKPSVLYQELLVIAKGLQFAKEIGVSKLEINSDSSKAISIIRGPGQSPW